MDCIDLGVGFFLIRFHEKDDLLKVINGGPWFVRPYHLTIRQWEPSFNLEKATFTTTIVWAGLPRLRIEYYDVQILERIGKLIGTPLRINAYTAHQSRDQYARICIQVDLDEPLIPLVRIGNHVQKIPYEGLVALCFSCGCVGHREGVCPLKIPLATENMEIQLPNHQAPLEREHGTSTTKEDKHTYGLCMLVDRRTGESRLSRIHRLKNRIFAKAPTH
ncbi:hypothetical protein SLA2020_499110 [Shorea laevis]